MMGRQSSDQDRLFYSFDLETIVPLDHLLRGIDNFLDLSDLRDHLSSFYSHTGRPSINLIGQTVFFETNQKHGMLSPRGSFKD